MNKKIFYIVLLFFFNSCTSHFFLNYEKFNEKKRINFRVKKNFVELEYHQKYFPVAGNEVMHYHSFVVKLPKKPLRIFLRRVGEFFVFYKDYQSIVIIEKSQLELDKTKSNDFTIKEIDLEDFVDKYFYIDSPKYYKLNKVIKKGYKIFLLDSKEFSIYLIIKPKDLYKIYSQVSQIKILH